MHNVVAAVTDTEYTFRSQTTDLKPSVKKSFCTRGPTGTANGTPSFYLQHDTTKSQATTPARVVMSDASTDYCGVIL